MKKKGSILIVWGLIVSTNVFAQGLDRDPEVTPFTLNYLLIYACLFLIVILFVLYFVQAGRNRRLLREVHDAVYHKLTREYKVELNQRLSDGKSPSSLAQSRETQDQIEALQKRLFKLEDLLRTQPVKSEEKAPVTKEHEADVEPIALTPLKELITEEVFYLSTPNADGSFNVSSAQQTYRLGASIYEFRKLPNSNKASFTIDLRESSVKLALRYAALNIDPVCEAENEFNMNAKRIICKPGKEGQADLSGDKWTVSKKAKIFYES